MHGGPRGRVLRLKVQSDHMDPRLEAGKCRKVEGREERLRNVLNKIIRVHHGRSKPRGEDGMHS